VLHSSNRILICLMDLLVKKNLYTHDRNKDYFRKKKSPVLSLGIFSEASDKSMCPGSTQPFEMNTRIFLGVKTAGA
jgi:hypothetical protein